MFALLYFLFRRALCRSMAYASHINALKDQARICGRKQDFGKQCCFDCESSYISKQRHLGPGFGSEKQTDQHS